MFIQVIVGQLNKSKKHLKGLIDKVKTETRIFDSEYLKPAGNGPFWTKNITQNRKRFLTQPKHMVVIF